MNILDPIPLFPTRIELGYIQIVDYPDLNQFLDQQPNWQRQHWLWGIEFLKFIARNKSEHTYTRFRTDVERLLLWSFFIKKMPIDTLKKNDILEFADFCWSPPENWIALDSADRFTLNAGQWQSNPAWRPFRLKRLKNRDHHSDVKKRYKPSQETLNATFTAVSAFYKHLIHQEYCFNNPAMAAKPDCRYFIKDAQVKEVRRLSEEQWAYLLNTAHQMADLDSAHERNLFVIACLKVLFLRISELSERAQWSPAMNHFWQDEDGFWWLKVFGKGRKLRDVSVPESFLPYLTRYRLARGLTALPHPSDDEPLVTKIRGHGGMSSRHLIRIVQQLFDAAYEAMKREKGEERAFKLKEASTHWLRHTGASMEVERGRALKDLSEDLGHASMATTDTIYVQSENRRRALSGKARKV